MGNTDRGGDWRSQTLEWNAAFEGNYQIEMRSVGSPSWLKSYDLWVVPLGGTLTKAPDAAISEDGGVLPVIPPSHAPGWHIGLPSPPSSGSCIYLPIVLR